MSPLVKFVTLGCAKNQVDTSRMIQLLRNAGYTCISQEPDISDESNSSDETPDVVVVNTCGFLERAVSESISVIFNEIYFDDDGNKLSDSPKLVVTGCVPARYGKDFEAELPEVDAFLPCSLEENIVGVVNELMGKNAPYGCNGPHLLYEKGSTYSYIKISDGCNRFCSYCTIPFIRGRYHSFSYDHILEDCKQAQLAGSKELILIAQDTGVWGTDLTPSRNLSFLLCAVAEQFPQLRIRVLYLQPEGITDELLETFRTHSNICPYFDIPLQHCNKEILHSMHRKGSFEEYLSLVERIRREIPRVALRTTLIAGYPGETEEQFEELCDFVDEAQFDYVGVFPFSPEEGTKAAELPDQIDEEERIRRAQVLRDMADAISSALNAERIGSTMEVLVEGREEDGQLFGRSPYQAPEVDGLTYVDKGEIGLFGRYTIVDSLMYELEGEME